MMCLIYFYKGATRTTKKSIDHKAIIQKHSKDFGGSFEYPDIMKPYGRSRNNYYKYKIENSNLKPIAFWAFN